MLLCVYYFYKAARFSWGRYRYYNLELCIYNLPAAYERKNRKYKEIANREGSEFIPCEFCL